MLKFIFFGLPLMIVIGLLVLAGFYISPKDELERSNAIVVVSGGDTEARTLTGVELYQDNWAPLLIFSGAAQDPHSPSNAMQMRDIAISEGVPPDSIALEESATNTRQNANKVSHILQVLHAKQIILVTSPYHQRRTATEFRQLVDHDVKIINYPANDNNWSRAWWWTNPKGWYLTLVEVPKTLFALLNQQLSQ